MARKDDMREKRKQLAELISDARQRRADAIKERDAIKGKMADADFSDPATLKSADFQQAQQLVKTVGEIDDEIADLQQAMGTVQGLLGESESNVGREVNPALSEHRSRGWDGHRLLAESAGYQAARDSGVFYSKDHFGSINIGEIATREEMAQFLRSGGLRADILPGAPAGSVGTSVGIVPDFRGLIPPNLMSLSLLDLLPVGTTDSNLIEYVQVTAIPQAAAETAELSTKPEAGLTLADATAPVRTIAAFIKAARQALADTPFLATLLNTLLPYDVRRRLLAQVLAGDGVGQNLRGIYNTSGVAEIAFVGGSNPADMLLRGITAMVLTDNEPNFAAINPQTFENLLLLREQSVNQNTATNPAAFQGEYLYGSPGALPQGMVAPTIWGLRMTASRVIPANRPLVGDSSGAMLVFREGVNTRTSDSDQDDFVKNRVTILAECRVAFPVWRPVAFVIVDVA